MTGMIQGGWEYVVAAYAISGLVFTAYAVSLFQRLRAAPGRSP